MLIYLHNRPPQQSTKNHPPPPSPHITSSPLAASSPHLAPALFVCSSIRLFIWLVVASSLCPLLSCPVLSRRRATLLRCVLSLIVSASHRHRVVAALRHHVSSRLVDVSCPLTHLVSPALFDCCVVTLHLVITASFCLVVRPPLSLHDVDAGALVAHLPPWLSTATTFNGRPTCLSK